MTIRLLVIGGGRFLGHHLVQAASARGDRVTVFNRGRAAAAWPAGVEHRAGDRQGDLAALATGTWDVVVDCCGYLPGDVARMVQRLQGRVGCYVFVSSVSVYAGFEVPNREGAPLARIDDPHTAVVDGRSYGPLKALCEAAVVDGLGAERSLCLRPGLIVGPNDPTQRFPYWPARLARAVDGEPVLVPGTPADPVQFIDVRDLVAFMLRAIDDGLRGVFNVTSPPGHWTWGGLLDACARVAGCRPRWVWVDAEGLARLALQPWSDLPVWLPARGEHAAFARTDVGAAQAAGLALRPLDGTVADTLAWHRSLPAAAQAFVEAGLAPEREAQALAAWLTPP